MNETMSSSSSELMQLYQQTINTSLRFSDATSVTVTADDLSGNNSYEASASDHYLPPKGCILKPIRRRSRASKRTPVTLLNADAKNFRSLVQRFTGCRRRSTSVSFGNNPRGPININFAHASVKNDHHYDYDQASIPSRPFVETKREKHEQQQHCQQHLSKGEHEQEQQMSFESITSGDPDHDDLFPQGFVMDDVLHEIWL